jgi:hypothetical protein
MFPYVEFLTQLVESSGEIGVFLDPIPDVGAPGDD